MDDVGRMALVLDGCKRFDIPSAEDLARRAGVAADDLPSLLTALQLLYLGDEVATARFQMEDAMRRSKEWMREAADAGVNKSFIARASGVTRQTVYDALKE